MGFNSSRCPLCNSLKASTPSPHLLKCKTCGIIFNPDYKPVEYDGNYFIHEYKERYGKTYLEDFEAIYQTSLRRLHVILDMYKGSSHESASLLDIGSAMGFFLKAARDSGIGRVKGVEISQYAAEYTREKLNIETIRSSFDDAELNESFDIITAWYFIEHCKSPDSVVKRIYNLLSDGGVFALSVPSFFGPMYVFHRLQWDRTHPCDHRIDFSPSTVKRYLKRVGFKKVITRVGASHPERMISRDSILFAPLSKLYDGISRIISFSDTLEVYSVK